LSVFLARPDQVEDLGHLVGHHVAGTADHLEGEGHVLEHRLVGQEPEVLEDAADVAPEVRHPPFGQVDDVAAGLPDLPGVGQLLAQQQPDERGLARARRSDQEDELALVDLDRYVAQRDGRSLVGLGDVVEADHGFGR
jgi:hypothetical protein